ncbi:MAG TPA: hypothetical protein VN541_04640, partial [Tepidisphaeraceae bacterium]|nr:hypothetical protein [Tepidisphaeraceae bacterium]
MNVLSHWLLTVLLLTPLLGAGTVALVRKSRDILWVATATTSVSLILSLLILLPFHWNDGSEYEYGPAGIVQLHVG